MPRPFRSRRLPAALDPTTPTRPDRPRRRRVLNVQTLEDRCPTGGIPLTPLQPFNGWGLPDGAFDPRVSLASPGKVGTALPRDPERATVSILPPGRTEQIVAVHPSR